MSKLQEIKATLQPYRDVILFMVVLLGANYFWKFTIDGEEWGGPVHWFGWDITAPFDWMAEHITHVVYTAIAAFRDTIFLRDPVTMQFETGNSIRIVWGCTAIKQSFIWVCIMLFARGSWKHKLWFIPLGLVVTYAFNILRIFLIALAVEHHPEWFEFLHTYLFKYVFYGVLFLMWVWWAERFVTD